MKNGFGLVFLQTRICRAWWLPVLFLLASTALIKAGDFTYTTNSDNTLTITDYTGPGGAVDIPSGIDGKTVTSIGAYAFCEFWAPHIITSVKIPVGVTSIGDDAFSFCDILTSVTIPNSVTRIGNTAFWACRSLTNVMIPNSVTSIGDRAFWSCNSLATITIPNSVISIGGGAFQDCGSMTLITVDAENPIYSSVDGVLLNKSKTMLIQFPGGKAGSYTIPDSVTSIGVNAFLDCSSLTSVMIGNSVTNIGDYAFYWCYSLKHVMIGSGVTSIGEDAFYNCSSLISATIPDNIISIGGFAFSGCTSLTGVTIGNGITCIADGTFNCCPSLPSVTIPDSVSSIGEEAFRLCKSLISVVIGNRVTSINPDAFSYCTALRGVYFKSNAPALVSGQYGSGWFDGDDHAIAYYLPGTTGWGRKFGGRPTALWNRNGLGSTIKANGKTGEIAINYPKTVSIAVAMNAGDDAGIPVDWWVVARVGSSWYYMHSFGQWTPFDGNLSNCHPMYQGPLFNLPETPILNAHLPAGSYTFWFAVSYPMDGILNVNGPILVDSVNVTVR